MTTATKKRGSKKAATTKKRGSKKAATTKKTPRAGKEIQALAARVKDVHEIDLDEAIEKLAAKDRAKPGIPPYTLVVACFGQQIARAAFSAEKIKDTPTEKPAAAPKKTERGVARSRALSSYPAQTIERVYKNVTYKVALREDGTCEVDGKSYSSLTACALEITGYGARGKRISGPFFFGLTAPKKARAKK